MFFSKQEAQEKLTQAFQSAVDVASNSFVLVGNNTVRDKVIRCINSTFENTIRENGWSAMAMSPLVILHTSTVHASSVVLCLINGHNEHIDLSVISN